MEIAWSFDRPHFHQRNENTDETMRAQQETGF